MKNRKIKTPNLYVLYTEGERSEGITHSTLARKSVALSDALHKSRPNPSQGQQNKK